MTRATLIAGFGGGLLALLLLAATGTALGDLARARAVRMDAAALAERPITTPAPLIAAGLRVPGGREAQAAQAGVARIRGLAAAGGVLVEQAEPLPGGGGLIRLRIRLSGADKAVVALIDRIERDAPLMRLRSWRVQALADNGVRVEGEAVAAWR